MQVRDVRDLRPPLTPPPETLPLLPSLERLQGRRSLPRVMRPRHRLTACALSPSSYHLARPRHPPLHILQKLSNLCGETLTSTLFHPKQKAVICLAVCSSLHKSSDLGIRSFHKVDFLTWGMSKTPRRVHRTQKARSPLSSHHLILWRLSGMSSPLRLD